MRGRARTDGADKRRTFAGIKEQSGWVLAQDAADDLVRERVDLIIKT